MVDGRLFIIPIRHLQQRNMSGHMGCRRINRIESGTFFASI
jgi:hypothetical protein